MIDKKIHQIWLGNKIPPRNIMKSWRVYCDSFGWEYNLWTENEISGLTLKNQEVYNYYKSIGCYHGMSDVARIEILNRFGGMYLDVDFYSWQNNISEFLRLDHDMLIAVTENNYPSPSQRMMKFEQFDGYTEASFHIANGCFLSPKNNNILTYMLDNMTKCFDANKEYVEKPFKDLDGLDRKFGSADLVGCFFLSHCAKKYPFILMSPTYVFHSINYVLHKKLRKNVISSYICDHNEETLNLV